MRKVVIKMNIYDVAKLSGVSTATVSRVINNGSVSKKTREKVMKVMTDTTFSPNIYARGLNLNSMKLIGVIVSDIADLYFSKAVSIIERELKRSGYDIILYCTGDNIENTNKYIQLLKGKKTDGIIIVGSKFKGIEKKFDLDSLALETPVIMINAESSAKNIYSLTTDDKAAVCETVEYLVRKGHTDFLYLYDAETASGLNKLEGFRKGLIDSDIPLEKGLVVKCQRDIEKAKIAVIDEYRNNQFTAIVTSEDELAVGALKAAISLGISVPDKVAITGYNNSLLALSCTPELTSVDNKVSTLCELSVKVLMDAINKQPASNKIKINCELVVRKTT